MAHLLELAVDINAGHAVPEILADLIDDLTSAIPSYAGLRVTVVHTGHPVVLTVFTNLDHAPVTASLRLPLALAVPTLFEPGSLAVFWAHTPGAFIDMAADLSYALLRADRLSSRPATDDPAVEGHHPRPAESDSGREPEPESIALDVDLPPQPRTSGITGLSELSTINRALGVLIARGYEPGAAKLELRRAADSANLPIADIAALFLH